MKRLILAALALVFVIGLQPQAARAQESSWNQFWSWFSHGEDPHLTTAGVSVGIGTSVASYFLTKKQGHPGVRPMTALAAYGVTTAACTVIYPMVGTVLLNRPLTPREAYVGLGDCIVPFIGGWLVDRVLPHDAWTDGLPPPKPGRHRRG